MIRRGLAAGRPPASGRGHAATPVRETGGSAARRGRQGDKPSESWDRPVAGADERVDPCRRVGLLGPVKKSHRRLKRTFDIPGTSNAPGTVRASGFCRSRGDPDPMGVKLADDRWQLLGHVGAVAMLLVYLVPGLLELVALLEIVAVPTVALGSVAHSILTGVAILTFGVGYWRSESLDEERPIYLGSPPAAVRRDATEYDRFLEPARTEPAEDGRSPTGETGAPDGSGQWDSPKGSGQWDSPAEAERSTPPDGAERSPPPGDHERIHEDSGDERDPAVERN